MSGSSRYSPVSSRSWRSAHGRKPDIPSRSARRVKQFVLAALIVALLGLLAWLISLLFVSRMNVVAVAIPGPDTFPPVPFALESRDAIAGEAIADTNFRINSVLDLKTRANFDGLQNALQQKLSSADDTLLLWVGAHGVSAGNEACLLCSEAFRGRAAVGQYQIQSLLDTMHACAAPTKVLILDTGYLLSDARLGMIVNEFPAILAEQIAQTNDPTLWVLASHSLFERSHVSAGESLFARAVSDGLQGAADGAGPQGQPDQQLDIRELHEYVRRRVAAAVWEASQRKETQTPQLYWGGGDVTRAPQVIVGQLTKPSPSEAKEQEASKNLGLRRDERSVAVAGWGHRVRWPMVWGGVSIGSRDGEQTSAAPTLQNNTATPEPVHETKTSPAEAPSPPSGAKEGETSPQVPDAPSGAEGEKPSDGKQSNDGNSQPRTPPPNEQTPENDTPPTIDDLLARAWRERDKICDRQLGDGWSPRDYAPHLWREYEDLLVSFELRVAARRDLGQELSEMQAELANLVLTAEMFHGAARTAAKSENQEALRQQLMTARRQFGTFVESISSDRATEDFLAFIEAWKQRNDGAYAARDYVRWHALASFAAPDRQTPYPVIKAFLARLRELNGCLDEYQASLQRGASESSDAVAQRARGICQSLRAAEKSLRQAFLDDLLPGQLLTQRAEHLPLPSAILDASQRQEVLVAIRAAGQVQKKPSDAKGDLPIAGRDKQNLQRAQEHAELELDFLKLSDPEAVSKIENGYTRGDLASIRGLGAEIRKYYESLPDTIRAGKRGDQIELTRLARNAYRVLDPRDVLSVRDLAADALLSRPFEIPAPPPAQLAMVVSSDALELDRSGTTPLTIELTKPGAGGEPVVVWLEFDKALLRLQPSANVELATDGRLTSQLDAAGCQTLQIQLAARDPLRWQPGESIAVHVRAGALSQVVNCSLAPLDAIKLSAIGDGFPSQSVEEAEQGGGSEFPRLLLTPYGNGVTNYTLQLQNTSAQAAELTVEFFDLADAGNAAAVAAGQAPVKNRLGPTVSLPLPAHSEPTPVSFALPPAKPEAAKSKDNEASAPPPVDDKPPSLPISTRLACVLQDKKQPQRRWIKTIEMAPLLPRNYLDAQVQYDIDRGQITIDLGLQPQLLQVLRPEQKFQVKLDVESGVEVSTSGDDVAVLSAQQPHQQLSVKVGAEPPQDVVLSLSVNDWPRAFLYRVHCDRIARGPVPRYQPHRVKITEPAADYAKQPAAELTAKIQVDAGDADFPRIHEHVAAAGNGSSQDRIVVGIDANRDREFSRNESQRQLYDTRQIDLQLRFEPPQRISVATHVSDFEVQLESQGLKDTVVHLRAELWTMSDDKVSKLMSTADPVSVRIDGRGPQFSKLDLPTRVEKGKPLEFSVEVVDQELESASGVRDVRFVIVEPGASANQGNKQHTWGEKEEAAAIPLALDERNPARYWGAVATDGEKLRVKQSYTLLIQARDRVGNVENLPTKPFRVDAPSAAKAEMPRRFDLPVRVMFGTKPREGITVTVTGAAAPDPQPTSSDGRAVFKGLPPGKYTIEAQGAVAGYTKKSPKKEVELPFPPGAEAGVTVSLETP